MIGSLRGTLLDRSGDGEVLVEVQGIGYRVTVSPATVVQLGEVGTDVFLHVHHHIREDAQPLYGFQTRDERVCFEALLGLPAPPRPPDAADAAALALCHVAMAPLRAAAARAEGRQVR